MISPHILKKVEDQYGEHMAYLMGLLVTDGSVENTEEEILAAAAQWEIWFENDNYDADLADRMARGEDVSNG